MIKVQNLGLTLEGDVILEDVAFEVKKGEYVGLIGPNGAGKSSLVKLILGFYKPTTGTLRLSPNTQIGYVPQSYALSAVVPISVKEVLSMSGVKNLDKLQASLESVGLPTSFLKANFHQLSGGQKQRVIIARALCADPNLLIFDEPLNGVDYETKQSIYALLATLNKTQKLTVLFVSHEVDHIMGYCDHVLCLNRTMHTGCHPLDFAQGKLNECPVLDTVSHTVPVHHHHDNPDSKCSC